MKSTLHGAPSLQLGHGQVHFVKKRDLSKATGLSGETLKKYRLTGRLIEDIHWVRVNSKLVLYNLPLILDWIQNSADPDAHRRAIEAYRDSLLSSQKRRR